MFAYDVVRHWTLRYGITNVIITLGVLPYTNSFSEIQPLLLKITLLDDFIFYQMINKLISIKKILKFMKSMYIINIMFTDRKTAKF